MLYVTGDDHLGHENILDYCKRPFKSMIHHDMELVRRWNDVVKPEDTVIHLGDFCFERGEQDHRYWRKQLNGDIIFIQGNHDSHVNAPIQSLIFKYGGLDWWCSHYPERRYKHNLCAHVHCYSDDTEVLTFSGFKFLKNVVKDDLIATLNPETNTLEYYHPTVIIKHFYSGKMIRFIGQKVDILCTPETQLYARPQIKDNNFYLKPARVFHEYERPHFKIGGVKWNGNTTDYFVLPKYSKKIKNRGGSYRVLKREEKHIPMKLWASFLGWYLSEGNTRKHVKNKRYHYKITLTQYGREKRDEIYNILNDVGSYVGFSTWKSKTQVGCASIQLWNYLKQFGGSREKYIPQYIKQGDITTLTAFFDTYLKGDGYKDYTITTASPYLRDGLMEIAIKLGKSPSYGNNRTWYYVSFRKKLPTNGIRTHYEEQYSGMVYDITVPNHIFLMRRNGKICWTGNSLWRTRRTGTDIIINCGVDQWNYTPVSMEQIVEAARVAPNGESV